MYGKNFTIKNILAGYPAKIQNKVAPYLIFLEKNKDKNFTITKKIFFAGYPAKK